MAPAFTTKPSEVDATPFASRRRRSFFRGISDPLINHLSSLRETTVGILATILVTFAAWTWGGVVPWAQWIVAILGLVTLAVALLAGYGHDEASATNPARILLWSSAGGILVAGILVGSDLDLVLTQREATLQLLPATELGPLRFTQWGLRGLLSGLVVTLVGLILAGIARPSDARSRLLRLAPFWLGLFLFAWIACQSWNTWGIVDQGDLFWRILPHGYVGWLPSGLAAPFASEESPGGMNGWRQLLILVGPWALFCALAIAVERQRIFAWLAGVVLANAIGVALAGNLSRANKSTSFLGFAASDFSGSPFGPFVYANHAACWLMLACALGLALVLYLVRKKGDRADRGGPHLVAIFFVVLAGIGAASTLSLGGLVATSALFLVVAPAAYMLDRRLRASLSPLPTLAAVGLGAVVIYSAVLSADAEKWRWKFLKKQQFIEQTGSDDRDPLRRATWRMVEGADLSRQLSGWGAGSYRWVSPVYLAQQPEFLDRRGKLNGRVTHAHNDWLQSLAEWGAAGAVITAYVIGFLGFRAARTWRCRCAHSAACLGGLLVFAAFAWFDFVLFQPHLVLVAILAAWLMLSERDSKARARFA